MRLVPLDHVMCHAEMEQSLRMGLCRHVRGNLIPSIKLLGISHAIHIILHYSRESKIIYTELVPIPTALWSC
jgi:hypothetical protein